MNNNDLPKPLQIDKDIILGCREKVIIILILYITYPTIIAPLLMTQYKSPETQSYIMTILSVIQITQAVFCGNLYYAMSRKRGIAVIVGVLSVVLTWFMYGIGTIILSIYLIIKSNQLISK